MEQERRKYNRRKEDKDRQIYEDLKCLNCINNQINKLEESIRDMKETLDKQNN